MVWDDEEACNTRLTLRLGITDFYEQVHSGSQNDNKDKPLSLARQHFSFPLHVRKERSTDDAEQEKRINGFGIGSSSSRVFADNDNFKAKFKDHSNGNQQGNNISRKKLRLSEEQATMLENSFSFRNILSPAQKEALAEELNLQPRQVEVWFQNRRARTKVKQTEVDCELLKKRCQSLVGENRRLKEELEELRCLMKLQPQSPRQPPPLPLYVQLEKAAVCRPILREESKIAVKKQVIEGGLDVDGAS